MLADLAIVIRGRGSQKSTQTEKDRGQSSPMIRSLCFAAALQRQTGVQEGVVRWHYVGGACAARPHRTSCGARPPPKRHAVRYFGVLSSHATSRSDVVPKPAAPAPADDKGKPKNTSKYISWSELLRRTFGIEILCTKCKSQLRLIALIKTEEVAKKILKAMHLPSDVPPLRPARPPPHKAGGGDDWLN